jgi:hypothetical protein
MRPATHLAAKHQLRHRPNAQRPDIFTVADLPSELSRYLNGQTRLNAFVSVSL